MFHQKFIQPAKSNYICNNHQINLVFLVQVISVAFKNRKLPLPESHEELYEVYESATLERIAHTNQMR